MSDAVWTAGNLQEVPAVGEAGGQAVSPSMAFRGNYALLMADGAAWPSTDRCAWFTNMQLANPELSVTWLQLIG